MSEEAEQFTTLVENVIFSKKSWGTHAHWADVQEIIMKKSQAVSDEEEKGEEVATMYEEIMEQRLA